MADPDIEGNLKVRSPIQILSIAATLGAWPALAAGLFPVPEGCTAYATVQQRNCKVSQHYRCAGDAPGDQWAAYMDGQGVYYLSRIDSETRWVESIDAITGESETIAGETDPASFTTLLQSGRDDFDFETTSSAGETRRYRGFDQLTGDQVTVGGTVLERTRFDLSAFAADGSFLWRRQGKQLIQRDWRLFFSDTESFDNAAGETVSTVDTPVEIALPGGKGFLSTEPKYDCDTVTAQAEISAPAEGALP